MVSLKDRLADAYGRRAELEKQAAEETEARAKPAEALKQADLEIEALRAEQAAADRIELIAELKHKCDDMEALIEKTPAVLTVEFAQQWIAFCKECSKLRGELGIRSINLPDHLLIKFYQATFWPLFPLYVGTKPAAAYVGKSFLELFRDYKAKFAGTETEISRLPGIDNNNDATKLAS